MLPVLGIIFGLFVAFSAAQVWNDSDRASTAVSREASALRAVMLLAAGPPAEREARLRDLIRGYIEQAATGAASANHAGRVNEPVSGTGTREWMRLIKIGSEACSGATARSTIR